MFSGICKYNFNMKLYHELVCKTNFNQEKDGWWRLALLPFTVRVAVLFLSPVSQIYSPLSSMISLFITRLWVVAFCCMVYFSPWQSTVEPFLQVTLQSALEISQDSVASPPALASWLSSSFLKVVGAAARQTNLLGWII